MTYSTKRTIPSNVSASYIPAQSAHEMEEETDEEFDRKYYEYLSRYVFCISVAHIRSILKICDQLLSILYSLGLILIVGKFEKL